MHELQQLGEALADAARASAWTRIDLPERLLDAMLEFSARARTKAGGARCNTSAS